MTAKQKKTWSSVAIIAGLVIAGVAVWYFFIREKEETV